MTAVDSASVKRMTSASPAALAWQAEQGRLFGIAYRMLGDYGHAEDVVSEVALAAVHEERTQAGRVRSWPAWLTTVCVRRSIDRVRSLASIREEYPGSWLPEPVATDMLPEDAVASRELLSLTLLHLAEQLTPEARAAVVLHRAFAFTTPEIGEILEKSPAAVRQLISRAERQLQIDPDAAAPRPADRAVLDRLVTAIESGDIDTVLTMFDRDVVLFSDGGGKVSAARKPIFGDERVTRFYLGILTKAAADYPNDPLRTSILEVNGALAVSFRTPDRQDVLEIGLSENGLFRSIRQLSNPDKLTRLTV